MPRRICALALTCFLVVFSYGTACAQGRPNRNELMKTAHRLAEQGQEYIMHFSSEQGGEQGGIYVFYNNPRPLCYTYVIPGAWVLSPAEDGWRSRDKRQFVGVAFQLAQTVNKYTGGTLVERAAAFFDSKYEEKLGQPLVGVKLEPFDSAVQGTWKWTADPMAQEHRHFTFPTRIFVDFSPDAYAEITIQGTTDDDELARRILSTLKTTKNPECYLQLSTQHSQP